MFNAMIIGDAGASLIVAFSFPLVSKKVNTFFWLTSPFLAVLDSTSQVGCISHTNIYIYTHIHVSYSMIPPCLLLKLGSSVAFHVVISDPRTASARRARISRARSGRPQGTSWGFSGRGLLEAAIATAQFFPTS